MMLLGHFKIYLGDAIPICLSLKAFLYFGLNGRISFALDVPLLWRASFTACFCDRMLDMAIYIRYNYQQNIDLLLDFLIFI